MTASSIGRVQVSPRDEATGVGFGVDVGGTFVGIGSGVFVCEGGGSAGNEVGVAVGDAHPDINPSASEISMNFWKDFMTNFERS